MHGRRCAGTGSPRALANAVRRVSLEWKGCRGDSRGILAFPGSLRHFLCRKKALVCRPTQSPGSVRHKSPYAASRAEGLSQTEVTFNCPCLHSFSRSRGGMSENSLRDSETDREASFDGANGVVAQDQTEMFLNLNHYLVSGQGRWPGPPSIPNFGALTHCSHEIRRIPHLRSPFSYSPPRPYLQRLSGMYWSPLAQSEYFGATWIGQNRVSRRILAPKHR